MLLLNRTLLKMAKGIWKWIILIVCVRFVNLLTVTYFAELMGGYLGSLFDPAMGFAEARQAALAALAAALVMFVSQLLQGELEYRCEKDARHSLRKRIFAKILELDAGNIEKIGPVSAVTSSIDAVENMQVYYSRYLPSLIFSLPASFYLFFRLKDRSLAAGLILLSVSLILLPMNNIFRYKIESLRKTYWQSLDSMTSWYLDGIRGLTTLKLFERDREHAEVLSQKAEKLNRDINSFMKVNFTSFLASEGLIYSAVIIVMLICVGRAVKGTMSAGDCLTVLLLSYSYFSSFRQLMSNTHSALTAVSAAGKTEEILNIDTSRVIDRSAAADPENYAGIRMDHVSFGYEGRRRALEDVSLCVPKGKVTALCGLSGCGKSTAAALLMRFMDPESGHIYLEGKDYLSLAPQELRKNIVMIPQTVTLFSGTIRDNLRIAAAHASEEELLEAVTKAGLRPFVDSLEKGLDSDVGENGSRLSGGQKQKMGIARALLSKCEYMIFDEATSSVDPDSENEIWKCIRELSRTRTLVIISHRLSSIRDADVIYVLENGKVREAGDHEELTANNGLYRRLCEEQRVLEEALS
ncbi:MAG: ATP-binding cassette domain-containing protein [Solobacterium sp.]|nr:ATP-binding cassette domain-containing protein [Solobacterium sp.]